MRNKWVEYLFRIREGGVDVYGAIKALQYSIVLPPVAAYVRPGQHKLLENKRCFFSVDMVNSREYKSKFFSYQATSSLICLFYSFFFFSQVQCTSPVDMLGSSQWSWQSSGKEVLAPCGCVSDDDWWRRSGLSLSGMPVWEPKPRCQFGSQKPGLLAGRVDMNVKSHGF